MGYVGHIVFEDPIKESTAETLKRAGELGLEIKILTGDSAEVALHVAQGLGMNIQPSEVFIGSDIENIEEEKRYNAFKYIKIFARVNPKEKYAIIKALSSHHSVMFLGEGVNDAPALKTADVGMVVEEASDIAKESADIVLTQRDLSVIVEAIYLGRQIMNNIGKYILITLTGNFGSLYSLSLISIISKSLPLLPTQVLLENILTDVPMISVVNSPISKSEERRPVKQNIKGICYTAVSLGFATLFVQFLFYKFFSYLPEDLFRTLWLIEIILFEFILIVSLRTNDWFWKAPPLRRQTVIFFLGVVLFTVLMPFVPLLQKAFHLAPYGIKYALPVVGTVLFGFAVVEVMKRFVFSKKFSS
jgi:Mg2+-importing ATPase